MLKDKIDKLIDSKKGEELWQDAVRLAIKNNPTIAKEVLLTIRENKEHRFYLDNPKYGLSKTKSFRRTLRYPHSVLDILCLVDPDNFPAYGKKGEKTVQKMMKAFPEFCIAEVV